MTEKTFQERLDHVAEMLAEGKGSRAAWAANLGVTSAELDELLAERER